ncbi:CAP domain-containing protein [Lutibacter flavus]|uniref:Cysteine-rich secretory protein family protein n=1 Tax=Lutibacter flavus TaxID=691689 RepID=A0A238VP89_9FLAO|nr:CAP domain-containing protein [Lutibacter flavus]SNR36038.1 Cysteine-rich secretory protein family protein [Lutibacter flavus]
MKTLIVKLTLFLFFFSLFTSCSPEEDDIYFDEVLESKISYTPIENEILDLVNNYRVEKGLISLNKLNIISSVAETHTHYMVNLGELNHDYFPERHEKLVQNANAKSVGENVAFGYSSAKSVVNAWLLSDSHREIIENPGYTHFGISTDNDSQGNNYFTHIFIKQ